MPYPVPITFGEVTSSFRKYRFQEVPVFFRTREKNSSSLPHLQPRGGLTVSRRLLRGSSIYLGNSLITVIAHSTRPVMKNILQIL